LTIATSATGADWVVNKHIRTDRNAPKIAKPTLIEMELSKKTTARKTGLGDNTVAEAYVGYKVKSNVPMLEHTRCEYSILLKARNGRIYIKEGFAYQRRDTVANLNRAKETVIQKFSIMPNTKIVGYRVGLYNANVLHDEIAWTAADILERGYSETWYEK